MPVATRQYALVHADVVNVVPLTPRMVRVTLRDQGFADFPFGVADQWVKLFFPLTGQDRPPVPTGDGWYERYKAMPVGIRPSMRTYTIRAFDRAAGTVDVDMVLHGDSGPGSAWAGRAGVGDRVAVFGPGGVFRPRAEHEFLLLAGDETAVPAIAAILESAPAQPVVAFVEVEDERERLALDRPGAQVTWLYRDGRGAGSMLPDAVREAALPVGRGYGWLGGEARAVRSVRRALIGRGFDRHDIDFVGYWRRGRTEDQA